MPVDTPYKIILEFRKQAREFTDDELFDAINVLKQETFKRSTYGGRPHLSLYFAKEWVRKLDHVFSKPNKQTTEVVEYSTDWPMLIPAHKQERKKKLAQLTGGRLKRLGHKSGLNLTSPKQFDLASPANSGAYQLYNEHYLWRFIEDPIENPVSVQRALKTGDDEVIRDAFSAAIQKLPRLSSKNYKRWVSLLWKWGQYVTNGNILKWRFVSPIVRKIGKDDRTPSKVRIYLDNGLKAIARRA